MTSDPPRHPEQPRTQAAIGTPRTPSARPNGHVNQRYPLQRPQVPTVTGARPNGHIVNQRYPQQRSQRPAVTREQYLIRPNARADFSVCVEIRIRRPLAPAEHKRLDRKRRSLLESNRRLNSRESGSPFEASLSPPREVPRNDGDRESFVASIDPRALCLNDRPLPDNYSHLGPVWERSNKQPGQPGYGYRPDGPPTGSSYIEYVRNLKISSYCRGGQTSVPERLSAMDN